MACFFADPKHPASGQATTGERHLTAGLGHAHQLGPLVKMDRVLLRTKGLGYGRRCPIGLLRARAAPKIQRTDGDWRSGSTTPRWRGPQAPPALHSLQSAKSRWDWGAMPPTREGLSGASSWQRSADSRANAADSLGFESNFDYQRQARLDGRPVGNRLRAYEFRVGQDCCR